MAHTLRGLVLFAVFAAINLTASCPTNCRCIGISNVQCHLSCCSDSCSNLIEDRDKNRTLLEFTVEKLNSNCQFNITSSVISVKSLSVQNATCTGYRSQFNVTTLQVLDLSRNHYDSLMNCSFEKHDNLISLNLSTNMIKEIQKQQFKGLEKLQVLDLSKNIIEQLKSVFNDLVQLQYLNLSNNRMQFISEDCFSNLWLLQHLDLSQNKLSKMAPGTLQLLPNLARLFLRDNPDLGDSKDGQLLIGLGRQLQQVDISRTGMEQIPDAFTHTVRFLTLTGNNLKAIRCGDLENYPLLQFLDLANNVLEYIEEDALGRMELLAFIYLSKNQLRTVPKMLPEELKLLSLSENKLESIDIDDFTNLPNLKILLLQKNKIATIQENAFIQLITLEVLDLSDNPIKTLTPSTFNGPLTLRDLRLCFLNLSQDTSDVFFPLQTPETLQMLHLRESPGLAKQFLLDSSFLAALYHLQYLDLRISALKDLRNDLIQFLAQLKVLRLKGNEETCSKMTWLSEWLPLDKTRTTKEECYFTSLTSSDEPDYNCTFSEHFSIGDNLPTIRSYSHAAFNRLMKYYSRFNETESVYPNKHYFQDDVLKIFKMNFNISEINYNQGKSTAGKDDENQHQQISENEISTGKKNNKKSHLPEAFSLQRRNSYDIGTFEKYLNEHKYHSIDKSEVSVNKPFTKVPHVNTEKYQINTEGVLGLSSENPIADDFSASKTYIALILTLSVSVTCLGVWMLFKSRKRKRLHEQHAEEIEVNNISGGVLW